MKISVLKLISGEEVLARENESLSGSTYSKPMMIQMMQSQQGMGMGLVPWIMSAPDADVEIDPKFIVCKVGASKQVEDAYLQQTSGIDLSGRA